MGKNIVWLLRYMMLTQKKVISGVSFDDFCKHVANGDIPPDNIELNLEEAGILADIFQKGYRVHDVSPGVRTIFVEGFETAAMLNYMRDLVTIPQIEPSFLEKQWAEVQGLYMDQVMEDPDDLLTTEEVTEMLGHLEEKIRPV